MSTTLLRSDQFHEHDFRIDGIGFRSLIPSFKIDRTGIPIPVVGAAPFGPPTNPSDLATACEYFLDGIRFWEYAAGTSSWTHLGDFAPTLGETNTMSNVGAGNGLYVQKTGVDFELKSLVAGTNVSFTVGADSITINSVDTGESNTASNIGTGTGLYNQKTGSDLEFKTLKGGAGFTLTPDVDSVTISYTETGEANTASSLGAGESIFSSKSVLDLQFKSLVGGTNVSLVSDANTVTINATGEANTASNLGAGEIVFKQKASLDLEFKTLVAGTNISLVSDANTITISATGTGEANTASNVGTGGFGMFKQKSALDLEFKNLHVASSKLTLTDDGANNRLSLDLGTVSLLNLSDTPGTIGSALEVLRVNAGGTAYEFGSVVYSASNIGTDGFGPFKQLTGTELEFYNIAPANAEITVVQNGNDLDIGLGSFTLDKASNLDYTGIANNEIIKYNGASFVKTSISSLLSAVAPTAWTITDGSNPNALHWGDTLTVSSVSDSICVDTSTADTLKLELNLETLSLTHTGTGVAVAASTAGDFLVIPSALNGWYLNEVRMASTGGTGSFTGEYNLNGTGGVARQVSVTAGSNASIAPTSEQVSTGDEITFTASSLSNAPEGFSITLVFQSCTAGGA
jgi:hypothetical protein